MYAILLGLTAALSWSFHDLLARVLTPQFGPLRIAMVVLLAGAALLLPLVFWRGEISFPTARTAILLICMGLAYAIALAGLLTAFSLAPVSIVGPLTAGYPALVVVWGVFNGLSPAWLEWLAMASIVLGAILVGRLGPPDGGMAVVPAGKVPVVVFASLVACLGFAASFVLGQAAASEIGAIETTFWSRFPAAIALLPLMLREQPASGKLSAKALLGASGMAACDVVAVTSINWMGTFPNKEFGAMAVAAYGAIAALLGVIFLREKAAAGQWLGIGLIVAGIAFLGTR